MPLDEEKPRLLAGEEERAAGDEARRALPPREPRPRPEGDRGRLRADDVEGVEPAARSTIAWLDRTEAED